MRQEVKLRCEFLRRLGNLLRCNPVYRTERRDYIRAVEFVLSRRQDQTIELVPSGPGY